MLKDISIGNQYLNQKTADICRVLLRPIWCESDYINMPCVAYVNERNGVVCVIAEETFTSDFEEWRIGQ